MPTNAIYIGTAGWSIPREHAGRLPEGDSALQRYSALFNAVEINSTFKHVHRAATFERWAATVPPSFRFSVKLPKTITHDRGLVDCADALVQFYEPVSGLGDRLGPLLVQLPPKLAFDPLVAARFFADLRRITLGQVVCEPRHPSWFAPQVDALLVDHQIARVAADPAAVAEAARPGGHPGISYTRLHGAPHVYYTAYEAEALQRIAASMATSAAPAWCIFDNTASGAALGNALDLIDMLARGAAAD